MKAKIEEGIQSVLLCVEKVEPQLKTILLLSPDTYTSIIIPFIKGEELVEVISEDGSPYLKRSTDKIQNQPFFDIDLYSDGQHQIIRFPIFNSDQIDEVKIYLNVFFLHLLAKKVRKLNISIGLCYDLIIEHHIYLKFFQFLNRIIQGKSTTMHQAISLIFMKIQVEDDAGEFLKALEDIGEEINSKQQMIYGHSLQKYCLFKNHLEQDQQSFKQHWFQICDFESFELSPKWYNQCQLSAQLIESLNILISELIFSNFGQIWQETLKNISNMDQGDDSLLILFEYLLEVRNFLQEKIDIQKDQSKEIINHLLQITKKCFVSPSLALENVRNILFNLENLYQIILLTKIFDSTPYYQEIKKITKKSPFQHQLHPQYLVTQLQSLIITTLKQNNFDLSSIKVSEHLQNTCEELKSKLQSLNAGQYENNGIMRNYTGNILDEIDEYDERKLRRLRMKKDFEEREFWKKLLDFVNPPKAKQQPEQNQNAAQQENNQAQEKKEMVNEKLEEEKQPEIGLKISPEQQKINNLFEIFQKLFKFKDFQACLLILLAIDDFPSIQIILKKHFLHFQIEDDQNFLQSKKKFILSIIIPYLNTQIIKKVIQEDVCECLIRCINFIQAFSINDSEEFKKKQKFLKTVLKKVSKLENKQFEKRKKIVKKKQPKSQFYSFLAEHLERKTLNNRLQLIDHPLIVKQSSQSNTSKLPEIKEQFLKKIDAQRAVKNMQNYRFFKKIQEYLRTLLD